MEGAFGVEEGKGDGKGDGDLEERLDKNWGVD